MRVDPPFHVLQNFFPRIHSRKTLKKAKRTHPSYFHNCGKTVEKTPSAAEYRRSQFLG
jgi:hypothetical protein